MTQFEDEPQKIEETVPYPFSIYIYIYISPILHLSSYRVARTIDGADIELNFSNLMRLDGGPSFLPSFLGFLERFSSRRYEERVERERKVERM